jgi:hypothetical protein
LYILQHYSLDDANDPSIQYLKMLEGSLVWEARSLYFVAVAIPVNLFSRSAALAIMGLTVVVVIAMVRPRV